MSLPPSLRYKKGVPEINIFFKLKDGCGTRPHEGLPHWISYFTPTYLLHSPPFLFLFPPYFSSASLTSFSQLLPRHFTNIFLSFYLHLTFCFCHSLYGLLLFLFPHEYLEPLVLFYKLSWQKIKGRCTDRGLEMN